MKISLLKGRNTELTPTTSPQERSSLKARIPFALPPAAILLTLGFIYSRTLLPTVGYWGDAAKFMFLGKVLGTPHPSGYPLYLVLNHLFVTYFPRGTLALRANLLSAGFSVLAGLFVYLTLRTLRVHPAAALAGSLTFGFSYTLWSQSLIAEVYTLDILLLAIVTFALLRWHNSHRDLYLGLAIAVYAVSFGNHLSVIAFLPAFATLVLNTDRSLIRSPRWIAWTVAWALLGAAQYSYIAWRAGDPNTAFVEMDLDRFLLFLQGRYGLENAFRFSPVELVTERLPLFLGYFGREFHLLIPAGLLGLWRTRQEVRNFLILGLFSYLLFIINFDVREMFVFYLPVYFFFALAIGLGLEHLNQAALKRRAYAFAWLVIPLVFLLLNYSQVDLSRKTIHARIVERILATVDETALVIVPEYDYASFLWYYTLGLDYESKKGIFAMPVYFTNAVEIRRYLEGEGEIVIPPERTSIPPGLDVYMMEPDQIALQESGLSSEPTSNPYIQRITIRQ